MSDIMNPDEAQININGVINYCMKMFEKGSKRNCFFHPNHAGDVVELMERLREKNIEHQINYSLRRKAYVATVNINDNKCGCTHEHPHYALCTAVALMVRSALGEDND